MRNKNKSIQNKWRPQSDAMMLTFKAFSKARDNSWADASPMQPKNIRKPKLFLGSSKSTSLSNPKIVLLRHAIYLLAEVEWVNRHTAHTDTAKPTIKIQ